MAPDNSAHSFALSGASRLPTAFPSRATGSFVYGKRYQDESFLPHTINPAITSPQGIPDCIRPSTIVLTSVA